MRLFQESQTIITEDSRQTRKLLDLLKIQNKPKFIDITKNHDLNWKAINKELERLLTHQRELNLDPQIDRQVTLLVSDSGTPGISDPGFEILQMALKKSLKFEVLPGANAMIPAVILSGIISKEFLFLGFLPIKKGRQTLWQKIVTSSYPVVLYESVHRLEKFIQEATTNLASDRKLAICKDLTKLHENIWRGRVQELISYKPKLKGEYVIVIDKMSDL